jgi:hypothetical protein
MPSSKIWHRVVLVRTDVSEGRAASIFNVETICEGGTTLTVGKQSAVSLSQILSTLTMEGKFFPETSALRRPTRRHIPEDGIVYLYLFPVFLSSLNVSEQTSTGQPYWKERSCYSNSQQLRWE